MGPTSRVEVLFQPEVSAVAAQVVGLMVWVGPELTALAAVVDIWLPGEKAL